MTFDSLFAPHGEKEFVNDIMGRSALHSSGAPGRFRDVLSWSVVNRLLAFGGLGFPRLRLLRKGQEVGAAQYLANGVNGYPRLLVGEINSALRAGSVLVIESVEELHEPVWQLCTILEGALRLPVRADLNASLSSDSWSDPRRNESDLIVMGVEGQKAWRIYPPTADLSPAGDAQPASTATAAWEGMLMTGDVLYIPKGWWYCDRSSGPGLDLGIVFTRPTARDVLRRTVGQIIGSEEMQRDCPLGTSPEEQSAFLGHVQAEAAKAFARPGLVLGFCGDLRKFAEPRVHFDLPWSAAAVASSEGSLVFSLLRFLGPDSLWYAQDEDAVEVPFNGRILRFRDAAGAILEVLCSGGPVSVRGLLSVFVDRFPREVVLAAISELTGSGVAALQRQDQDDRAPNLSAG